MTPALQTALRMVDEQARFIIADDERRCIRNGGDLNKLRRDRWRESMILILPIWGKA